MAHPNCQLLLQKAVALRVLCVSTRTEYQGSNLGASVLVLTPGRRRCLAGGIIHRGNAVGRKDGDAEARCPLCHCFTQGFWNGLPRSLENWSSGKLKGDPRKREGCMGS